MHSDFHVSPHFTRDQSPSTDHARLNLAKYVDAHPIRGNWLHEFDQSSNFGHLNDLANFRCHQAS